MISPHRLLSFEIRHESDVVGVRQRARRIADLLGFDPQDQTRIATAVSEIARNAFQYAGGGKTEFWLDPPSASRSVESSSPARMSFRICIADEGPGIPDATGVLAGHYISRTGMGLGMIGARRLMDDFEIETSKGKGTRIRLWKSLPLHAGDITSGFLAHVTEELMRHSPEDPYEEIRRQNQELLRTLEQLRRSEARLSEANESLMATNRELEETNRGVVALYMELDEKAEDLRRVNEVKSRFLSYMSHEFRTPLNSVLGLSRLLLDRVDGDLSGEQETQVRLIHQSARDVLDMVNDLLDLAKVEAGKTPIYIKTFHLPELFTALRGLMRPLLNNPSVELIIEEPVSVKPLCTDETKVTQILRNLISNSLKFTERGEVRMKAVQNEDDSVTITVSDTGIGIAPEHQESIFEEYSQIDSSIQRQQKGTGLGLPLVKRFTEILGGQIHLHSRPGVGTTFTVRLPINCRKTDSTASRSVSTGPTPSPAPPLSPVRKVLMIDDDPASRYLLRNLLPSEELVILEATNGLEGMEVARTERPQLIFLDYIMPGIRGDKVLEQLKGDPVTQAIPVIIRTSKKLSEEEIHRLRPWVLDFQSKEQPSREVALQEIRQSLFRVQFPGSQLHDSQQYDSKKQEESKHV